MVTKPKLIQIYWPNEGTHRGDTVKGCHNHYDYNFGLEKWIIEMD